MKRNLSINHFFGLITLLWILLGGGYKLMAVELINGIYYSLTGSGLTATATVTYPNTSATSGFNAYNGGTKPTGNITIPNKVSHNETEYSVVAIDKWAFYSCSSLSTVTISNTITEIGDQAFQGCNGYQFVIVFEENSSLAHIGNEAFKNCNGSGFTSIALPNELVYIGNFAFNGCTKLTSVSIPESVTFIGTNPYQGCNSITNISVDPNNTYYNSGSSSNCIIETLTNKLITGCKNTVIPNSVTTIGDYAFINIFSTGSTTTIHLPNSITAINTSAFDGCSKLTTIALPENIETIGNYAFNNCKITSVVFPISLTTIGDYAFQNNSLTDIIIPYSVETIGNSAFWGNPIASIILNKGLTTIGGNAFRKGTASTTFTSVIIPTSVTSIGSMAFYGNTELVSVTIMGDDTSLGGTTVFHKGSSPHEDLKIYVPSDRIDHYKNKSNWKTNYT